MTVFDSSSQKSNPMYATHVHSTLASLPKLREPILVRISSNCAICSCSFSSASRFRALLGEGGGGGDTSPLGPWREGGREGGRKRERGREGGWEGGAEGERGKDRGRKGARREERQKLLTTILHLFQQSSSPVLSPPSGQGFIQDFRFGGGRLNT